MPEIFEQEPQGLIISTTGSQENTRKYRYSGPELLVQRMIAFMEDDDYMSLQEEIALSRAILESALVSLQSWEERVKYLVEQGVTEAKELPKPPVKLSDLLDTIGKISKLVEREHSMRYSEANMLTMDSAVAFALTIAQFVNQFVKNEEEKTAVLEGIRKLLLGGRNFNLDTKVIRRVIGMKPPEQE